MLQLSLVQLVKVGTLGLALIAVTLVDTFMFTLWLGRRLGVDRKLAQLIASGTSICGASAVIATNPVTHASDEDVSYGLLATKREQQMRLPDNELIKENSEQAPRSA